MNRTDIEWCDFTWNPVTGCKRGCAYCYAKRVHDRFNRTPFSTITYHLERMAAPSKRKQPAVIFVGSMSDIEYWHQDITRRILDVCRANPQHTFMFLSKSPKSFAGFDWPKNTMQGLTLTCESNQQEQHLRLAEMAWYPRPFLSVEPLLGVLHWNLNGWFERVIVGAMTGPGAIPPKPEWIESVKQNVPAEVLSWKENIKQYIEGRKHGS